LHQASNLTEEQLINFHETYGLSPRLVYQSAAEPTMYGSRLVCELGKISHETIRDILSRAAALEFGMYITNRMLVSHPLDTAWDSQGRSFHLPSHCLRKTFQSLHTSARKVADELYAAFRQNNQTKTIAADLLEDRMHCMLRDPTFAEEMHLSKQNAPGLKNIHYVTHPIDKRQYFDLTVSKAGSKIKSSPTPHIDVHDFSPASDTLHSRYYSPLLRNQMY
jgi:hypothetical protein